MQKCIIVLQGIRKYLRISRQIKFKRKIKGSNEISDNVIKVRKVRWDIKKKRMVKAGQAQNVKI